jgi:O-acetyl-ADP-ribose deacetylase (regulator of RNase III)
MLKYWGESDSSYHLGGKRMIYQKGDLLSVKRGILLHGCNAQGVMQSGVAKEVRAEYPEAYLKYTHDINYGYSVGDVSWCFIIHHDGFGNVDDDFAIASGITQEFYGRDPNVQYVCYNGLRSVMEEVFEEARKQDWPVHMPKIGCGLGNGDWSVVEEIITKEAEKINFPQDKIFIWEL